MIKNNPTTALFIQVPEGDGYLRQLLEGFSNAQKRLVSSLFADLYRIHLVEIQLGFGFSSLGSVITEDPLQVCVQSLSL